MSEQLFKIKPLEWSYCDGRGQWYTPWWVEPHYEVYELDGKWKYSIGGWAVSAEFDSPAAAKAAAEAVWQERIKQALIPAQQHDGATQ